MVSSSAELEIEDSDLVFRPLCFRPAVSRERRALEELLRRERSIRIHDHCPDALRELPRTLHPGAEAHELERPWSEPLRTTPPDEYGCWFYYPWSRRLVHTLEEADFVELRTSRNRYKITDDEQERLSRKRVGVVGLSVGHATALTLASERSAGSLRLADFDHLELSNLNRVRTGLHNLGLTKAVVAAREIAELDPFLDVQCFPGGITAESVDAFLLEEGKLDLCIDECDDLAMKVLLRVRARRYGIPVMMETSDRGTLDVERFDLEPGRAIFHGRAPGLETADLASLTNEEKIPYILDILGGRDLSARMVASLLEVGDSLTTWPQLASAVTLGGGVTADVARRILLGRFRASGRYHVDLEKLVSEPAAEAPLPPASPKDGHPREARGAVAGGLADHGESARSKDRPFSVERARRLVEAAIRAPSGGNAQPWRFVHHPMGALFLLLDSTRPMSALDFDGAGTYVGLGAAIENTVLAAQAEGLSIAVDLFPRGASGKSMPLVARFACVQRCDPRREPERFVRLSRFIEARHTQRKPGPRRPLEGAVKRALADAVASEPGASLCLVEETDALLELAELVGRADRIRMLEKEQHRSMMAEMRWTKEEAEATCDGLDVRTLELTPADRAGLELCRSAEAMRLLDRMDRGHALAAFSRKRMAASSAAGLITVPRPCEESYVKGGRALQRMWLAATEHDVALQPMATLPFLFARVLRGGGDGLSEGHVKELLRLRRRYERVLALPPDRCEIMLFRLFRAEPSEVRALRRPVEEVLELS